MASVDGLVSGLNTSDIIKQLMQLERIPQQRLQSRQSAAESSILSLRTLNSKFLAISSAAEKFGAALPGAAVASPPKPTDWQLTTASSSDDKRATAKAVTGAPASTLSFNVKQLARASSYLGTTAYAGMGATFAPTAADPAVAHKTFTLTKNGGAPVTITTANGTLEETVTAINTAGAGVSASTVQVTPGQYRLQLTSTTTGAGTITLTDSDGGQHQGSAVVAGQDAIITLAGGTNVTRSSNTISDVLEGVTLTLAKADWDPVTSTFTEPPVTVTVAKDSDGIAARVQALVDVANGARSEAKNLTSFDPVTKAKGRLYGDSGVRGLVDRLRTSIVAGDAQVGLAGVTVNRDGVVEFDKAKFLARLAAAPAAVEKALGKDGLAGRLHKLADQTSRGEAAVGGPGLITSAITSRENQIASLTSNIESWDARLALKEKTLQRQYTALETALGKSQSQGAWLAGQLANLPKWGS